MKISALLSALACLLLATELPLAQDPGSSRGGTGKSEAPPKVQTASPSPETPFPFDLDRYYRYVWVNGRRKVGESTFQITRAPGSQGEKPTYRSIGHYRFDDGKITQKGESETTIDAGSRVIGFHLRHEATTVDSRHSEQEHRGEVNPGRLGYVVIHNGDPGSAVTAEMVIPADAFVFLNQAVDTMALLAGRILVGPADADAQVAYYDLVQVYQVHFTYRGEEAVDLGKPEKPLCRRYSFRSKEGQWVGDVWMSAKGRLIQYCQKDLRIYFEG